MKGMMCSVALLILAVLPVATGAQSGTMAKRDKMDEMEMKEATYTGCIAAGTAAGTFMLTHVAAEHMGKDAMKKDTMSKDAMAATTLTLASSSVDLSKHVGHKVSVTGSAAHGKMGAMDKDTMAKDSTMKDASAFTVKSLKMIAASCS
jgi:hypothetical protein